MKPTAPMRHTGEEPARSRGRPVRAARMALYARPGESTKAKLDRLVQYARSHKRALILTHDNPDPDSIAAGVALAFFRRSPASC